MMSKTAVKSLIDWTPVSKRIITVRFFSRHKMTLINAYAPTNDASDEVKDLFFQSLAKIIHDKLIITGDMNDKLEVIRRNVRT